jgi:dextranase
MAGQHLCEPSLKNAKKYHINTAETDQCRYAPGDTVRFRLNLNSVPVRAQLKIQYFIEGRLLTDETIPVNKRKLVEWNWLPPATDFRGYLVEIIIQQSHQILDRTTIAVDVSSDWKMFPRYGFISAYPIMSDEEIQKVIGRLNRLHINGVQFYDWHSSHHRPLKIISTGVAESWNDIANRINYRKTIEKYIAAAHEHEMSCMAYNLICGAWTSGFQEGVSPEWGLYKDAAHQNPFALRLPAGWASDLYFMNPANPAWRDYIFSSTAAVFEALDFDGWHVDQIGDLGVLYTFDGQPLELKTTYRQFLQAAKNSLNKKLVMNAVGNYAQAEISQAPVEFLYTEIWNPDSTFNDLVRLLDYNFQLSGRHNTILAAYMNYNLSSRQGVFNTPGILLTDAVIFANGGAHLEMGDHMLCHEIFPNANLVISPGLDSALTRYYDLVSHMKIFCGIRRYRKPP